LLEGRVGVRLVRGVTTSALERWRERASKIARTFSAKFGSK
jgi:hypothetical protein